MIEQTRSGKYVIIGLPKAIQIFKTRLNEELFYSVGTFVALCAVCVNHESFYFLRAPKRCKHYMIEQTRSGKYVIIGLPKAFENLHELVKYHKEVQ